jgi:excisionase family DNA binding protein
MAIDTSGYVNVAEAARRLDLSPERVRRRLREGKLKGRRVGSQWLVDAAEIETSQEKAQPLIPGDVLKEVDRIRRRIAERNPGYVFDAVEMVNAVRDDH